jgi:hypothetical protein
MICYFLSVFSEEMTVSRARFHAQPHAALTSNLAAAAAAATTAATPRTTFKTPVSALPFTPPPPIAMPSKSQSPRAAARAAARASAGAAAAAAEIKAVSKLSPEEMLVKGFGIELGDTDEAVREKGLKKMLVWLRAQKDVDHANMQKMSLSFSAFSKF